MIVPTIGRPASLEACLESLAGCKPRAAEILIVDQSGGAAVGELVERFSGIEARAIRSDTRGVGPARDVGIAAAASPFVAVTDDDCTVSSDWIAMAGRLLETDPSAIYTGSVLWVGDRRRVPSTIDRSRPRDYTGRTECRVLYPNNMAFARAGLIEFGGFDSRFDLPAEDNDFCYRWLRAGHRLRYEPSMRVWHHDWRSRDELREIYRGYGRGQGAFYAKHLRRGDLRMLRFIAEDLAGAARASVAAAVTRDRSRATAPWTMLGNLPYGFRWGWREYANRADPDP